MTLASLLRLLLALLVLWFGGLAGPALASPARIKDLVEMDGVRGNDLLGYGLVVGLNNSGDSLRNSPFTEDAIVNLLERLGVNVTGEQIRARNVAAVLVTAALPPFARAGSQIDVTVSAIGDARSLLGGTLVMTPLNAADGQIYAVAQGSIIAGGVVAEGEAETRDPGRADPGPDPVRRAGRARGRLRLHPDARHPPGAAQPRLHHRRAHRRRDQRRTSARGSRACSTRAPCGSTSPASASTSRRC